MKILLINKYHYLKGGAERAYLDMGEILTQAGHDVAYFAMQDPHNLPTAWSRFFVTAVDYHKEQSLWQKLRVAFRIIWNHEANSKLDALIQEFEPDIVHLHNIYHQLSPSILRVLKKYGIPTVMTLHDYKIVSPSYTLFTHNAIWQHTSGCRAIVDRVVDNSFLKSSVCAVEGWLHGFIGSYRGIDRLISPSHFLSTLCQELGLKQEVTVIPNPLLHVPQNQVSKIADKLVYVGRLSPEKGVALLLQALALYAPDKHLRIVGSGPEEYSLKQRVQELGLHDRVEFCGSLYGEDLDWEVMSAEALVVPSLWYENLPYVVTENQARGVVVIASASGGITERITHGRNGFLFPMGDAEVLGKTLKELKSFDLEAIRMQAVLDSHDLSPEAFLKQIEALYGEVIDRYGE